MDDTYPDDSDLTQTIRIQSMDHARVYLFLFFKTSPCKKKTFQVTIKLMYMKVNLQAVHIFSWTANEMYKTRLDTEAKNNSEMAHSNVSYLPYGPSKWTTHQNGLPWNL